MEKSIWEPHTDEEVSEIYSIFDDLTSLRVEALERYFDTKDIIPTGSRHIECPAKQGTDDDYLILLPYDPNGMDPLRETLVKEGWTDCLDAANDPNNERYKQENYPVHYWGAFRRGEVNIVIYMDKNLYLASVAATMVCKKLNVKDKERRIRIFRWFKFDEPLLPGDIQ